MKFGNPVCGFNHHREFCSHLVGGMRTSCPIIGVGFPSPIEN